MQADILICECIHTAQIDAAKVRTILATLKAAGIPYTAVPDLCGLAVRKDPLLQQFAASPNPRILACYPRTLKALFDFAGTPLQTPNPQLINLREVSAEIAVGQATGRQDAGAAGEADAPGEADSGADKGHAPEPSGIAPGGRMPPSAAGETPAATSDGEWVPWFPILDPERCNHCQQCLGFCLFGVFGLSPEGAVSVENPQACKTNCPACARICPQAAIIFPKYDAGVIAGAEVTDEALEQSLVKADLSKMFGSDVYESLAQRRRKGRSRPLLRPDLATAAHERKEFLEKAGLGHLLAAEPPPSNSTPPTPS